MDEVSIRDEDDKNLSKTSLISEINECQSCKKLKEEIVLLKKKLHTEDDSIPEALWDTFPPKCHYLRNMMRLAGYETKESVMKLRTEDERTKMFHCVKSMIDIVENKEEMFGVFKGDPQKVMLIPGHEPILKKFIDVVENLSQAATNGTSLSNGKELTARIQKWLKLQPLAVKRANQIGLTLENSFSVTQGNGCEWKYMCAVCNMAILLSTNETGFTSCSNAYRHMSKVCWMNRNPKKIMQSQPQSSLVSFVNKKQPRHSASFIPTVEVDVSSEDECDESCKTGKIRRIGVGDHDDEFSKETNEQMTLFHSE